jgi:hypothetical protein
MIRPGYSGSSYFSGERAGVKFGWDFFVGTQARAVARNIFLDGSTFQNSRSVVKEPVVADLIGTKQIDLKLCSDDRTLKTRRSLHGRATSASAFCQGLEDKCASIRGLGAGRESRKATLTRTRPMI